MGRLLDTTDPEIIKAYENHIKELQSEKITLSEQQKRIASVNTTLEDTLRTTFDFIRNPYSLWLSEDLEDKRMVLKLAFAQRLAYDKKTGFRTAEKSLPFTVLGNISTQESVLVEGEGFEPSNSYEGRFTVCCH